MWLSVGMKIKSAKGHNAYVIQLLFVQKGKLSMEKLKVFDAFG